MNAPQQMRVCAMMVMALFAGVLGPWLYTLWNVQAINHDIFWLSTAAGRLWQGGVIGVDVYETNPPLSIYLYLPVYWLTQTGSSVEHAALLYSLLLLAFSFAAVMAILRSWLGLERDVRLVTGLSLLLIGSVLGTPHFGQRDQIIFFGLLPLLLVQLSITGGVKLPRPLQYAVMILGALALMLKPHYGVLPALVIVHRIIVRRRFSADPDLVVLALVGLIYSGFIWVFVPDYLHSVMPDAMRLYVMDGRNTAWDLVAFIAVIGAAVTASAWRQRVSLAVWFLVAAFCSLFVFALMHRNYMYQLIPAVSFFMLGLALLLQRFLRYRIAQAPALVLTLAAFAVLCLMMPHSYYPSREQVTEMPLTRAVKKACAQYPDVTCRFMLWSGSVRVTQLTSRYSGAESASRFPALWFMQGLKDDYHLQQKYAAMMGEDLKRYRPRVVVSCNEQGDDLKLFSGDPSFTAEWRHYTRKGPVMIDIPAYESGVPRPDFPVERCLVYTRM